MSKKRNSIKLNTAPPTSLSESSVVRLGVHIPYKKTHKQTKTYKKTVVSGKLPWLHNQIEREFSTLSKKVMYGIFITANGDRAVFKKLCGIFIVGPDKPIPHKISNNIDVLFDTFTKKAGPNYPDKQANQSGGVSTPPAGPYLQRLTTIGDRPITGNDMAKAIDEIVTILNDLQYLQEDGGPVIRGFKVLLNYFNGDKEDMQYFIRYYMAPELFTTFPPSINFDSIGKRLDNIIDFLNIYKNNKRIETEFQVEQGFVPKSKLKDSFFDKTIEKLDNFDQSYHELNRRRKLQFY